MDMLQDVKRDIEKAIEAGTSVDDFKQNYLSTLKKHGWTGQTTSDQKLVRPYRIEMIYQQSMDNAYAVGRFYQLKSDAGQYPYWEYVTKRDNRVRPEHKKLDGIIRRHDDAFWDTHTPPLGFRCRCVIQQVTLLADQVGSTVVDIWRAPFESYPPTVANSICASAKPTITSNIKSIDSTLTGWSKTINAGDVLAFNADSVTSITRVTITLNVNRT
jgi:SPP1 gp7 family putative phage head morphogenesis protein